MVLLGKTLSFYHRVRYRFRDWVGSSTDLLTGFLMKGPRLGPSPGESVDSLCEHSAEVKPAGRKALFGPGECLVVSCSLPACAPCVHLMPGE